MTPVPTIPAETLETLTGEVPVLVCSVSAIGVDPHPEGRLAVCLKIGTPAEKTPVHFGLSPEAALRLARDLRAGARRCLGEEEKTVLPRGAKKDRKAG